MRWHEINDREIQDDKEDETDELRSRDPSALWQRVGHSEEAWEDRIEYQNECHSCA